MSGQATALKKKAPDVAVIKATVTVTTGVMEAVFGFSDDSEKTVEFVWVQNSRNDQFPFTLSEKSLEELSLEEQAAANSWLVDYFNTA